MKILVLSDVPCKALWDYFDPVRLKGVDLILSAGDLPASYLSFLVTLGPCPVLYVHGNHDTSYNVKPPEGCECIDGKLYTFEGIRILGLGGSMRYKPGDHQYTEKEMNRRVRSLKWTIWRNRGFDILLTHAPAAGVHDGDDLPHKGFSAFNQLMDRYAPRYMVHGHVHLNYGMFPRETLYGSTIVVNAYERRIIEL